LLYIGFTVLLLVYYIYSVTALVALTYKLSRIDRRQKFKIDSVQTAK